MALDRQIPNSSTVGEITGDDFMDASQEELTGLWDRSRIKLTAVSGTNTITATMTPALTGALVDGMRVTLVPAASNTGSATLAINGGDAIDVVRWDGSALQAGDLGEDQHIGLEYDGDLAQWVMLTPPLNAVGAKIYRKTYTANDTWVKASEVANYSADSLVIIEAWGAGGGGATGGTGAGGGGGAYVRIQKKLSDLGSSETVTIGAGGTPTNGGGTTSFGSHAVAYGGAGVSATTGGGGGGALAGGSGASGGSPDGGAGATSGNNGSGSRDGGGGGGGGSNGNGGASLNGGGGGGGSGSGVGGTSVYGGNGGSAGAAGTAPGGGGGRNASGARGEIRLTIIG